MSLYFDDWKLGIHPVGTGRAPWLPTPFVQAMHAFRATEGREKVAAAEKMKAKVKQQQQRGPRG